MSAFGPKRTSSVKPIPRRVRFDRLCVAARYSKSRRSSRRLISRRSIQLTAEQEYVIRENVKDVRGGQVIQKVAPKVGEKIPPGVELHGFPSLVIEKVPQVKVLKFFVTKDQIVIVSPSKTVADLIRKH